jgi:hypothetical protein
MLVVFSAAYRASSARCPSFYTSDHRCWRVRLSLERIVDVVLLRKEVTLDLCVLEELKVTLCSTR